MGLRTHSGNQSNTLYTPEYAWFLRKYLVEGCILGTMRISSNLEGPGFARHCTGGRIKLLLGALTHHLGSAPRYLVILLRFYDGCGLFVMLWDGTANDLYATPEAITRNLGTHSMVILIRNMVAALLADNPPLRIAGR